MTLRPRNAAASLEAGARRACWPSPSWLCLAAGAVAWAWVRLEPLSLARAEALSVTVLDRNDRLLRAYAAPDGRWRLPVEVKDVDPRYLAMLLAYEDKRFRSHAGVDAVGAAAGRLAAHPPPAHRLGRLHHHHAGGAPAARRARPLAVGQDQAGAAGALPGAAPLQGRDPAPLPAAGALRRQPGGRARRLARLLRQGAAPALPRRGRPAGRHPAVARGAPPGPLARGRQARPQPRARPHAGRRRRLGRGRRARHGRAAGPHRRWRGASSPCWPRTWPTPRWRSTPVRIGAPPDARPLGPGQHRGAGARLRGDAGGPAIRRGGRGRPPHRRDRRLRRLAGPARHGALRRHRHGRSRCARRAPP